MTRRWVRTLAAFAPVFTLLTVHAAEWEKLPPMPAANGGFILGVVQNKIIVIGGTNWEGGQKNWLKDGHQFDPATGKWTPLTFDEPVAYGVAGPSGRDQLLFAGGFTGTGGFTRQVRVAAGGMEKLPGLSQATSLAAGGFINGRLIFCGGTDDPANLAGLRRATIALDAGGRVETLPDYPGQPFGTAASTVAGQSLFVFGGANWSEPNKTVVNTNEAHAFAADSKSWRKLRPFPYAVRGLTAVTLSDNLVYLAGGYKNDAEEFTDAAFLYDIAKDTYAPSVPLPYKAGVGLIISDGYLYCLGGEDKKQSRSDACFRIPVAQILK